MSILGSSSGNSGGGNTKGPIFREFKKQASFFFKEKIKNARLALTDVTPAQLLAEEATNGNPGGPDARTLKTISEAAFHLNDYCRIVDVLHKRILRFDKKTWRASYKALIVMEYLLTHGPERVVDEFRCDWGIIKEMEDFQYVDDQGFNWGVNVRKKSERILKLLEKGPLLKEERDKARKITRGIQGFGSFSMRTSSPEQEKVKQESSLKELGRCKSELKSEEGLFSVSDQNSPVKAKAEKPLPPNMENLSPGSSKGNMAPKARVVEGGEGKWSCVGESKPLLVDHKNERRINVVTGDFHPFNDDDEHLSLVSLLAPVDQVRAC